MVKSSAWMSTAVAVLATLLSVPSVYGQTEPGVITLNTSATSCSNFTLYPCFLTWRVNMTNTSLTSLTFAPVHKEGTLCGTGTGAYRADGDFSYEIPQTPQASGYDTCPSVSLCPAIGFVVERQALVWNSTANNFEEISSDASNPPKGVWKLSLSYDMGYFHMGGCFGLYSVTEGGPILGVTITGDLASASSWSATLSVSAYILMMFIMLAASLAA